MPEKVQALIAQLKKGLTPTAHKLLRSIRFALVWIPPICEAKSKAVRRGLP